MHLLQVSIKKKTFLHSPRRVSIHLTSYSLYFFNPSRHKINDLLSLLSIQIRTIPATVEPEKRFKSVI